MSRITKDRFPFICPMSWDEMTPSDNGRFCAKCTKEVFDLTDCSLEELHELQRKRVSICGMIRLTGAAAVAAASMGNAACQKHKPPMGILPPPDNWHANTQGEQLTGRIGLPPDPQRPAAR